MCMRVLDIDLDFFLDEITEAADPGERRPSGPDGRPHSEGDIPWREKEVIEFLENRCGLSDEEPIKGHVVKHHHEAFYYWRELIQKGELTTPFEVVHVDAHADLGMGDPNWDYLVSEVLQRADSDRATDLDEERFGCANYLAFAVACRWLKKLTYVYHSTCNEGQGPIDLLHYHFKEFNPKTNTLQLKGTADPRLLDDAESHIL